MIRYLSAILIGAGGIVIVLSLGIWQLQRLEWKKTVLAEIDAAKGQPLLLFLSRSLGRQVARDTRLHLHVRDDEGQGRCEQAGVDRRILADSERRRRGVAGQGHRKEHHQGRGGGRRRRRRRGDGDT